MLYFYMPFFLAVYAVVFTESLSVKCLARGKNLHYFTLVYLPNTDKMSHQSQILVFSAVVFYAVVFYAVVFNVVVFNVVVFNDVVFYAVFFYVAVFYAIL